MYAVGKSAYSGTANFVTPLDDATLSPNTFTHLDGYVDNLAVGATTKHITLTQLIENNNTITANVMSLMARIASLTAYTPSQPLENMSHGDLSL